MTTFRALDSSTKRQVPGRAKPAPVRDDYSVGDLRLLDVVLNREEKIRILGELRQHPLRRLVETLVALQLEQERLQTVFLRQPRHSQEEVPRRVVLGDRLQGLEVV